MRRLLALCVLLSLAACDRPVLDLAGPRVEVVRPADLGVVQTGPTLDLALRADVFGALDSLTVGGRRAAFDANRSVFEIEVGLSPGLNRLPVDVYDATGLRGSDTLFAFRSDLRPVPLPVSGAIRSARGGSGVSLPWGDTFFAGGASTAGEARADGAVISIRSGVLTFDSLPLVEARARHAAVPFLDGRTLLLGGARSLDPLVLTGSAEIVNPADGTSAAVAVVDEQGRPVRIDRTGHTARRLAIDGVNVIYLYGGVDAQGATLGTVEVFRWESDDNTLTRLTPEGGAGDAFPRFAAAAQAPVSTEGASEAAAVVFGLDADADAPTAFGFDWLEATGPRYPFDLQSRPVTALATPRTAASAVFTSGFVLVSGGRSADGTTLDTFEAYVPSVNRSFRYPDSVRLQQARSGHSATFFFGDRILILGGRSVSGAALSTVEVFQL